MVIFALAFAFVLGIVALLMLERALV